MCDATGPELGLEMVLVVLLVVVMVWMGSYLDERRIEGMEGWMDGKEGQVTPGTHQKETE